MATLIEAHNPQYSEDAAILTGNLNRVDVEVEDNIDKVFWQDLLQELCPEKDFHFDPYHTILNDDGSKELHGKGKSEIIKNSAGFNNYHIGCVDSDYDWMLSDKTSDGKTISSNKYLLQTYAYSIENLMCLSCTLADFCSDNTEENVEFDFEDYLSRLSKTVYPLLVWSAYLYGKGLSDFTPKSWHKVLVNTEKDAEASLAIIKDTVKEAVDELEKNYGSEKAEKDKMQQFLMDVKDVKAEEAYLYVRGHDLFDHLLNSVINPVITELRKKHFGILRSSDRAALAEYNDKNTSVKDLLQKNYRYKHNTSLYEKIEQDVSMIWNEA